MEHTSPQFIPCKLFLPHHPAAHTALRGGDAAALIAPHPGMQQAVSTGMLLAWTHFFTDTNPAGSDWSGSARWRPLAGHSVLHGQSVRYCNQG
jgi:hypothetical protein